MRPLESYCIYASMVVVWVQSPLAAGGLALLTAAHLAIERPRWQLAGMYAQVAYLLYALLVSPPSSAGWGWSFVACSALLLLAWSALACLFPMPKFPDLMGPFRTVGVDQRFVSTNTVEQPKGSRVGQPRAHPAVDLRAYPEIGLTVWYPSALAHPTKEGAPFLTKRAAAALGRFVSMPTILFSAMPLGRTRAIPSAPIDQTDQRLPWVVFSHGLGGVASMYSSQCSELASQGYVVFAPTHNDGSACLAELRESAIDYRRTGQPTTWPNSDEEKKMRVTQLRTRVAEIQHVIDVVFAAESSEGGWRSVCPHSADSPPYAGRIDLARLALVGHSFGAATMVGTGAVDTRAKAIVVHDLWMQPLTTSTPPAAVCAKGIQTAPILVTLSEEWTTGYPSNLPTCSILVRASTDGRLVSIARTRHSNYSDVPLFSQFLSRKMGAIGSIDFREGMQHINRTSTAFLAEKLAGHTGAFDDAIHKLGPKAVRVLDLAERE